MAHMHSTASSTLNRSAHFGFGLRFAARVFQPLAILWRPRLDPERVTFVAGVVASQPALRQWLLVIASESARVRRALLARGVQEMRTTLGSPEVAEVMEQLADESLLHAVTVTLFRQSGMEPPTQRTGPLARVRLAELGERLQQRESSPAA
jgi:hypothetical protein